MRHVFILGRWDDAHLRDVQSVIRDWSAVGLVLPSVWIDLGRDGRGGTVIDRGVADDVELLSWIPRHEGQIKLFSLQVLTSAQGALDQAMVQAAMDALRLPPGTPLVNLIAPVDGLTGVPDSAVFDSQVNVLVQPVDATGPRSPAEPLTASSRTFAMHVAAALATAGGLWTGMAGAPLDDEQPWSGTRLAAARGYVRQLDATAVLDRLATEVFGADGRLPVSRSQFGEPLSLVPPGAQLAAAEAAAHSVLDKHAAQSRFHPPPAFVPPAQKKLGFVEAFSMFFSFVSRALLGSPSAWVQGVLRRGRDRINESSTRFLFGDESQYRVVLGGLADGGAGADHAGQLDDAARRILGKLAPGSEIPPVGAPGLWGDVVRTAAVLVDGGQPSEGILTPTQGAARMVIDDPQRIASSPSSAPFPPVRLASDPRPVGPIDCDDPYLAMQVYKQVDYELSTLSGRQGGPGADSQRAFGLQQIRSDLAGWIQARRSFAWSIGLSLATELDLARAAQAEMLRPLPELTDEDLRAPLAQQQKVRRTVALWLGLILLVLIVIGVLVGTAVLDWKLALVLAVVAVLLGLFAAVLSFASAQRALFKAVHALNIAAARRQWLSENGVRVSLEVIRLAGLYRQGRCWAGVVAENVHDPFGGAGAPPVQDGFPTSLSGELPLSVTLASAHFSPILHEATVYQARARILRQGWLVEQVARRRGHVLADLKVRTGRDVERRIDTDVELQPEGPLRSYLDGLRSPRLRLEARQDAVTELVHAVSTEGQDRLLPTVRVDAGAIAGEHPWSVLTGHLMVPADLLADEGFSATGVTNRASQIVRTFWALAPQQPIPQYGDPVPTQPVLGRHQLDRMVVRWDLSRPVPPDEFGYFGGATPDPMPAPEPSVGGPTTAGPIIDVPS